MKSTLPSRPVVRRAIVAALAGASLTACASSPATTTAGAATEQTAARPASSSRYVLVQADIDKAKAENAYDLISKLRPDFLRGRNENSSFVQQSVNGGSKDPGSAGSSSSSAGSAVLTSTTPVMVYKDNVRLGGVDDLRQIQLATVREIRYLPGPEAVIRFGANNSGGAILITSR